MLLPTPPATTPLCKINICRGHLVPSWLSCQLPDAFWHTNSICNHFCILACQAWDYRSEYGAMFLTQGTVHFRLCYSMPSPFLHLSLYFYSIFFYLSLLFFIHFFCYIFSIQTGLVSVFPPCTCKLLCFFGAVPGSLQINYTKKSALVFPPAYPLDPFAYPWHWGYAYPSLGKCDHL